MSPHLEPLLARTGTYRGEGTNHEGQRFVGHFTLDRVLEGRGVTIEYSATGLDDGAVYHQEFTLLAPGRGGTLQLVTLSTNDGELRTLPLRRDEPEEGSERSLAFGLGVPDATDTYRVEVTLDLFDGRELGYRYAWGLPGQPFGPRSSVRLRPQASDLAVPS